jgi:divalent metal cation (Fe/Co/Zn/Cd) transporter
MSPGVVRDVAQSVFQTVQHVPLSEMAHTHGFESQSQILDPNAAWFAAVSVLAKEWLYRVTKKVADEERSSVLFANALHHRSDAYSSLVALIAILGTWIFPKLPLDPIGGGF